ncbi:endonuclease [Myxococcus sp. RHSTA-1-4]|uniref:endonuclease n=1 Tax=Myxococcus sp. RHSTA-1-4 TaxID=2874601 RepID=UPI001CC0B30B|nr:endonuclease [Myxococcus sp. RHSTA-1-4]MBZ4421086.1 endonuclease [Myxococcus sp. RHSTA-1-4]
MSISAPGPHRSQPRTVPLAQAEGRTARATAPVTEARGAAGPASSRSPRNGVDAFETGRASPARDVSATPRVYEARPNARIEDHRTVTSTLDVPEGATVESLALDLDLAHTYRGDLKVTLTAPSGKSAVVSDGQGGSADDLKGSFDLSAFAGESAKGTWTLTVQDTAKGDTGTLKQWGLNIIPKSTGPTPPPPPPPTDDPFQGLRDAALLKAVKASSADKHVVSYNEARRHIFESLDVVNGNVACVYTGREIRGGKIPKSSDMNVEHTWPQSKGATGDAKSDLHHLFPTDSKANARRSSFPFGEVVNVKWSQGGAKLGTDAQGRTVFEPPDSHKGNVARAMFYFSATYGRAIPEAEEAVLRQWNKLDAVDAAEVERNRRIANIQGNVNAFVEHSQLADRISDF